MPVRACSRRGLWVPGAALVGTVAAGLLLVACSDPRPAPRLAAGHDPAGLLICADQHGRCSGGPAGQLCGDLPYG